MSNESRNVATSAGDSVGMPVDAARPLLAAWVGGTRLIDNVPVTIRAEAEADR